MNCVCVRTAQCAQSESYPPIHQMLLPYHAAPCFQNNLYPVTFIYFSMTAYMAKSIGHKSMQPLWFNCFLSQHSVAKYMTCRVQAFFNCLFRGKNEREWANGRFLCHCVSIKVHRWYRWPHHFRYASYFAEIHPLSSETKVKFNSWWYYAKKCAS